MAEVTPIGRVNGKAAKIIREASDTGEPVFVLRAKDIFSVMAVTEYARLVELYGPMDHEFDEAIHNQLNAMKEWQREHAMEVRYPD